MADGFNVRAAEYTWQIRDFRAWTTEEAFSNGPVAYQFANGTPGTVALDDAFDGAMMWGLADDKGLPALTGC